MLGLLALPLVMRACGSLRDGGYGLTKVCGILAVGYVTWLAASLHVAVYSRGLIAGACGLLLVVSLALGLRPGALWQHLRARGRAIVWVEAVFLCGFLAFVAVRMAYPDLWHLSWGGERTQEISFTNAILRSQYFPPLDPWFAGGTLNYYYYGQYLTGMLMKLVGVTVPVGFNLALPTLFGLVLSAAFSIGYNATGRLWAGGVAAALEGVLGNLGPVRQFAALSPTHSAISSWPLIGGLRDGVAGLFAVLTHQGGATLPGDFFWTSSRLFPNDAVINEFPIWSFTYGDMHAHVVDEPIVLAVIGLALAASGLGGDSRRAEDPPARRDLPRLFLLGGLIALVAGATGPTNLWDLPMALAVVVIGFGLRGYLVGHRGGWALAARDMLVPGAVVGLLCLVLYRPFYATVLALSSGFSFIKPQDETEPYLLHLGLPLFVLTSFCIVFLRRTRPLYWAQRALTVRAFSAYYADRAEQLPRLFRVTRAIAWRRFATAPPGLLTLHVVAGGVLMVACALVFGSPTLVLIAALLTLVTLAFVEACARWHGGATALPFALALAALGLALTAIPDIVVQNEAGRMNTFFKLYNQAWPLLALSAAVALAALVRPRPARVALPLALRDEDARAPAPAALAVAVFGRRLFAPAQLAHAGGPPGGGEEMVTATPPAPHDAPLSPEPGAPSPGQPRDEAAAPPSPGEGASGEPPGPAPSAPRAAPRAGGATRGVPAPWGTVNPMLLWWGALALLVAGAALFPIFGTYSHLQLRSSWSQTAAATIPNGLDGAAFLRVLYPADAAAIDWINAHVRGTPVMVTSDRGSYRNFAGKVTMFTGLPSVAPGTSWTYEDSQERYAGQGRPQKEFPAVWVNQFESGRVTWTGGRWVTTLPQATGTAGTRMSDVETLYNTPDAAQALSLLREYHVSYIYVGTAERGDANSDEAGRQDLTHKPGFDPVGLAKFDRMAAAGQLAVVYHTAGVTIYQVKGIG
ncbi:MAG: hypothetical protein NVSMB65_14870 [Chloroflexota bacterium]